MQQFEFENFEHEMLKYASYLVNETQLGIDAITDRFTEQFGEENLYVLNEVLDEQ